MVISGILNDHKSKEVRQEPDLRRLLCEVSQLPLRRAVAGGNEKGRGTKKGGERKREGNEKGDIILFN